MSRNAIIKWLQENKNSLNPEWRTQLSSDLTKIELHNFSFRFIKNLGGALKLISNLEVRGNECYRYNELFNIINLYDIIIDITINSNYLSRLPESILYFKSLKVLILRGSKFFNLNINGVSSQIEELVVESDILPEDFYYSLQNFTKLRLLGVNQPLKDIILPYIPSLRDIFIYYPDYNKIANFLSKYPNINFSIKNRNNQYLTYINL